MNPIRTARAWWDEALGLLGVLGDVRQTVSDQRTIRERTKELAATERAAAMRAARKGCTHAPACPKATARDRQQAEVVWRDDRFIYLCNGLTLSARDHIPDHIPFALDDTESTHPQEATRP